MAEIKTDGNASDRPIKIQWETFVALFITRTTWHHLAVHRRSNGHDLIVMIHVCAFDQSR